MKKSIKEQLDRVAWSEFIDIDERNIVFHVPMKDALRLIRKACREAYCVGRSHGIISTCNPEHEPTLDKDLSRTLNEIISGPKRG